MIIFADFDGTLCDYGDSSVLARNLRAISDWHRTGNYFCVATGRNLASLERIIPDYKQYFDFLILDNGSFCINQSKEIMFDFTIDRDLTNEVIKQIRATANNFETMFYHDFREALLPFHRNTKARAWMPDGGQTDVVANGLRKDFADKVKIYSVHNVMPTNGIINRSHHAFVDIIPIDSGKESAVRVLSETLNENNIITVGDGINDYDMIKKYDGYAMAHAKEVVLQMVQPDHRVSSVSELIYRLL